MNHRILVSNSLNILQGSGVSRQGSGTIQLNGTVADDGLPLNSTLLAGWTQVTDPGQVVFGTPATPPPQGGDNGYDAVRDFVLSNPNGVWTYGCVLPPPSHVFTPFNRTDAIYPNTGVDSVWLYGGSVIYHNNNGGQAVLSAVRLLPTALLPNCWKVNDMPHSQIIGVQKSIHWTVNSVISAGKYDQRSVKHSQPPQACEAHPGNMGKGLKQSWR